MNTIYCLLLSIFFNTSSHFFFKKGVLAATTPANLFLTKKQLIKKYTLQPSLWLGLLLNGFAAFFWLIALSIVDLSYAFPFLSLNYILVPIGAMLLFQERLTNTRIIGISIICIGLLLIAMS